MRMRALSWVSASLVAAWMLGGCGSSGSDPAPGAPGGDRSGSGGSGGTAALTGGAGGSSAGTTATGGTDDPGTGGAGAGSDTSGGGGGGSDSTATGGSDSAEPVDAGSGGSAPADGSAPPDPPMGTPSTWITKPKGTIPNTTQPASAIGEADPKWKDGLISPTLNDKVHMNQPAVINGYLLLNGNEEFYFWDIADPAHPKQMSNFNTPNRCATCGQKKEGEAESHQIAFARYGNNIYEVTTSGVGVTIWNITDQAKPTLVKSIKLQGIQYDDFTGAVWGMAWQGDTIYVGSTDQGLDILDAKDPNDVKWVKRLPTNKIGGFSAGPVFAIGNVLVVVTPKNASGVATLDITDPLNPTVMSSVIVPGVNSYIGGFYRHYAALIDPLRFWDVLTDPYKIGTTTPYSEFKIADKVEYHSYADDMVYLGVTRDAFGPSKVGHAGVQKVDITDVKHPALKNRIWGRLTDHANDDQFTIQLGSMVVLGDDEAPYSGVVIAAASATPDTKPPVVDTVIPKDKSTVAVTSRVGITFSDNIEIMTIHPDSFIVRPVGGQAVSGKWGLQVNGIVSFAPDAVFKPKTTYEIVLPKGGLADLVGNTLAAEFKSTFTTQ